MSTAEQEELMSFSEFAKMLEPYLNIDSERRRVKCGYMSKEVSFKNRDRFIQLGISITVLRKMRGLSQEKLAEKAGISRSLLSAIEAPGIAKAFSMEVFYDIADALEIDPAKLLNASLFPDQISNK